MKRGDTLSALAQRHGTTVDALMGANRGVIEDRNLIITGEKLTIPTKDAREQAAKVQPDAPKPEPAPRTDADAGTAELAQPSIQPQRSARPVDEPSTEQVIYGHVAAPAAAQSADRSSGQIASPVAPQPAVTPPETLAAAVTEPMPTVVGAARGAGPGATTYEDPFEQQVVDLVNQVRAQYGLPPLAYDERLDIGAERHTAHQALVGQMAHEGIGDGTPQERMLAAGWDWAWGENAAVGQTSPEQVVREWMASPGHRANILNPAFGFLAVGFSTSADGRPYWTQSFGVAG